MLVHEALRLQLIADAGVLALVSSRIFPAVTPQTVTQPTVYYRTLNEDSDFILETPGYSGLGVFQIRYSAAAPLSAGGYDTAQEVRQAIRQCLEGFQGLITDTESSPDETLDIKGVFLAGTDEFYHDPTQTHHAMVDFQVWADQQRPTP